MNIMQKMNNAYLIEKVRVGYPYSYLAAQKVFDDMAVYQPLSDALAVLTNAGAELFYYQSDPDSDEMKWEAMKKGANDCIAASQELMKQIPADKVDGDDLRLILEELINQCNEVLALKPTESTAKKK